MNKHSVFALLLIVYILFTCHSIILYQTELHTWGNKSGIRMDSHLMKVETSILIAKDGWNNSDKRVKNFKVYITDIDREMEEKEIVKVKNGEATLTLDKVSFTSLTTK